MSRIRADQILNGAGTGAPNFSLGLQVGAATTIHTTGIDLGSGNIQSHNINSTGIITAASGSFSGNVSVGGTLTYEDVTSIDSVGVITAQSGIQVTGGFVGIGTNNPNEELHIHASGTSYARFTDESSGTGATDGVIIGFDHPHTYVWNYEAGDFVVATSGTERLRIDSDGEIGIGNDGSFGIFTSANDRNLILGAGANNAIQMYCGASGYGGLYFGDSTSGTARYSGYVEYKNNENYLRFATSEVERLRIDSDGNVSIGGMAPNAFSNYKTLTIGGAGAVDGSGIDLERSDGNIYGRVFADTNGLQIAVTQSGDYIRFETSGGTERVRITSDGLTFNGDTAAANALDDYEEGTYNPEYLGESTSGSVAYSRQTGIYTKIGRSVWVWIDIVLTSASGQVGTPIITMPFPSQNDVGSEYYMGYFIPWDVSTNYTSHPATAWMSRGDSAFKMYGHSNGNSGHSVWTLNTTGRIAGSFHYITNT